MPVDGKRYSYADECNLKQILRLHPTKHNTMLTLRHIDHRGDPAGVYRAQLELQNAANVQPQRRKQVAVEPRISFDPGVVAPRRMRQRVELQACVRAADRAPIENRLGQ